VVAPVFDGQKPGRKPCLRAPAGFGKGRQFARFVGQDPRLIEGFLPSLSIGEGFKVKGSGRRRRMNDVP